MKDSLLKNIYPDTLKKIIDDLHHQIDDITSFHKEENLEMDDNDKKKVEFLTSEVKKVLKMYKGYFIMPKHLELLAKKYGI